MQTLGNILIVVLALAFLVVKTDYKGRFIIWGAIGVALALMPLVIDSDYWLTTMFLIFIYIVTAQAFNIMTGYTGQVLMGQSSFFGMGALVTRLLWAGYPAWGIDPYPIWVALPVGALASVALAAIIGLPTLRLKGAYFAIGTLGMAIAMLVTVRSVIPGVSFLPQADLVNYNLEIRYYFALVLAALTIFAVYWLAKSRSGLALTAIREDEDAAASSGVSTFKYKVISLFMATFIAGLAGGVFSYYIPSTYFYTPFNLTWSLEPLMIGFIGGVGSVVGPTSAAAIFVALKELFSGTVGEVSVLIFGILFILVVLFLPGGLVELGAKIRKVLTRIITGRQIEPG
ncbi:branched-chain amino acid ABC transporter permease [Chloroflexota bacterium]